MLIAAFVSFVSFWLVMRHLSPVTMRRLLGYVGWVDVVLHVTILTLFINKGFEGLMQAEAAGIMFSLYLRFRRWGWGYSRFDWRRMTWMRTVGHFERVELRSSPSSPPAAS